MLFYYLTVLILNSQSVALQFQPQMNQLFYYLLGHGLPWLIIFVNPLVCLLPDFAYKVWKSTFAKTPVEIIQDYERNAATRERIRSCDAGRVIPKEIDPVNAGSR